MALNTQAVLLRNWEAVFLLCDYLQLPNILFCNIHFSETWSVYCKYTYEFSSGKYFWLASVTMIEFYVVHGGHMIWLCFSVLHPLTHYIMTFHYTNYSSSTSLLTVSDGQEHWPPLCTYVEHFPYVPCGSAVEFLTFHCCAVAQVTALADWWETGTPPWCHFGFLCLYSYVSVSHYQ